MSVGTAVLGPLLPHLPPHPRARPGLPLRSGRHDVIQIGRECSHRAEIVSNCFEILGFDVMLDRCHRWYHYVRADAFAANCGRLCWSRTGRRAWARIRSWITTSSTASSPPHSSCSASGPSVSLQTHYKTANSCVQRRRSEAEPGCGATAGPGPPVQNKGPSHHNVSTIQPTLQPAKPSEPDLAAGATFKALGVFVTIAEAPAFDQEQYDERHRGMYERVYPSRDVRP